MLDHDFAPRPNLPRLNEITIARCKRQQHQSRAPARIRFRHVKLVEKLRHHPLTFSHLSTFLSHLTLHPSFRFVNMAVSTRIGNHKLKKCIDLGENTFYLKTNEYSIPRYFTASPDLVPTIDTTSSSETT